MYYKTSPLEFVTFCKKYYSFLVDEYGCSATHNQLFGMQYQNATTVVHVDCVAEDDMPNIHIKALSGPYQGRGPNLHTLIFFKNRALNPLKGRGYIGPLKKNFETLMKEYAHALREIGGPLLQGDFTGCGEWDAHRDKYNALRATGGSELDWEFVYF